MPGTALAAWVADTLDRHRAIVLGVFTAALFYSTGLRASAKPFWHDEIYTLLSAGLPSIGTIWAAAQDGMDLAPPLTTLLTRGVRSVTGPGHVSMRLIPMLGFWIMTMALFAMVRRRANATAALTAALIPLFTAGYRHAYEARPYGLMMGLFALALYAWSEAAAGRRRRFHVSLLAIALAAGLWNHYYAVLAFLPIGGGELVRAIRMRRLDLPVAAALLLSAAAALPLVGLVRAAARQGGTFWAPASLEQSAEAYAFLLEPLPWAHLATATVVIMALAAVGFLFHKGGNSRPRHLPAHEIAAGVLAVLVPLAGVLLSVLVTGALVPRYLLAGVAGISLVPAVGVWMLARRAPVIELVLPAVLIAAFLPMMGAVVRLPHPVESRPLLLESLRSPGQTAVTGGLTFLQLWYYAPTELKPRLVYVAGPERALRYLGTDTIDLGYQALARWTPVSVTTVERWTSRRAELRVYAYGSGWLLQALQDEGAQLDEMGGESGARLYRVALP